MASHLLQSVQSLSGSKDIIEDNEIPRLDKCMDVSFPIIVLIHPDHTHAHSHTHAHTHAHIHTHTHTHTRTPTGTDTHTHAHTHTNTPLTF